MKELADLLIDYSKQITIINPEIDWGNVDELKHRMETVANRIYSEQCDLRNFYFSDFNGISPQGEIWEYLDSRHIWNS